MKTLLTIAIILFYNGILCAQNINPTWKHVGPHSTNAPNLQTTDPDYNPFLTGQIDGIAVDPTTPNHILVSSFFAGIWEMPDLSIQNPKWNILPNFDNPLPLGMGFNGVSSIAFRNHNELYAANFIDRGHASYSNRVFKYDYSASPTPIWSEMGTATLPFSAQLDVVINKIVFFPNDNSHVFLCTSAGLVESIDAGDTWFNSPAANPIVGNLHDIVFIEKTTPGSYFWYLSGSDVADRDYLGNALLMESTDNGATFTNVTAYTNIFSTTATYFGSYAGICLGNQTGNIRDIYISTAVDLSNPNVPDPSCASQCSTCPPTCSCCPPATPWEYNERQLHKLTKDITSPSVPIAVASHLTTTGGEYFNVPGRLIIGYDAAHNQVITGGLSPHQYNLANGAQPSIPFMHDDYHALYFNSSLTPPQLFLGNDGGFFSLSYNNGNGTYSPTKLNNGLDICQTNGFSGATDTNIYVYGQQDHRYTGLYNEPIGRVTAANYSTSENDGGLIDKFDGNSLIIGDGSSYNSSFFVSTSDPSVFSNQTSTNGWCKPLNPPSYYFSPGASVTVVQGFGKHPFFQQPFRKGRIYSTSAQGSIFQFDPVSKKFVWKVRLSEDQTHFTNSATLQSELCLANCTPPAGSELLVLGYQGRPEALSFSQLDKNKMYAVTANNDDACCLTAAQVVRYVGNNFDDLWFEHYEHQDNTGNPQWQLITPNWLVAPFNLTNTNNEIYHIQFTGVETSNWNKNKIYVTCSSNLPAPFPYKVIVYDGATGLWDNYSDGIPTDEIVTAMIMDHASNDGIYISTDRNVYYRQADMPAWQSYNNGAPGDVLPFLYSRQMEINYRENTVRAGTYGRGIWKSDLVCPSVANLVIPPGTVSDYKEGDDINTTYSTQFPNITNTINSGATVFRATNSITLKPGFTADATANNYFTAFIHGCIGNPNDPYGTSSYNYFRTNFDYSQTDLLVEEENNADKKLIVSPNPTTSTFSFKTDVDEPNQALIYNSFGQVVLNQQIKSEHQEIDLTGQPAGIYFIKVLTAGSTYTSKIIKR